MYHLGMVRFLRDARILPNVSHITAVSGGSIIAAHLCLNWDRYNGSDSDFDTVAAELLTFVRLDVRNRILRRYGLGLPLHWPRRLVGLSNRKLTRVGLLEHHYKKFLYGDTSLFQLPEHPRLHILATNISEGQLCSFNRDGLWTIRREPGHAFRIDQFHAGLATVPTVNTSTESVIGAATPGRRRSPAEYSGRSSRPPNQTRRTRRAIQATRRRGRSFRRTGRSGKAMPARGSGSTTARLRPGGSFGAGSSNGQP